MSKTKIKLNINLIENLTEIFNRANQTLLKFNQELAYATYRYNIQYSSDLDIIEGREDV